MKGAGRNAHGSSERVESRVLTLLLSQFDMVFGVFVFSFFLEGLKG